MHEQMKISTVTRQWTRFSPIVYYELVTDFAGKPHHALSFLNDEMVHNVV